MADERPLPDALLAEARKEGRGRLKIFLGAAPGVGKTYEMLEAAAARARSGTDVVVGIVETHGRSETEALLAGLETVPRALIHYRGRAFPELDIDAVIARRPQLALIDELAHSNIPGSRHPKRWLDVEDLLAAGIDVYTTLNIQHLESLNDIIARISGVRVRETLPDRVLELAEEIELIDLPPEELIDRLRAGKVYVQDQVARAIQNFFSKGNLTALRELAMRVAADRVDAQMLAHMKTHAIAGPWPTQDRLMVCLNESRVAHALVRTAKRMADRARLPWLAVTVATPGFDTLSEAAKDQLAEAQRLAESLGAELVTLHAESHVADEILAFARARNVNRLLIGRPRRRRLFALTRESVAHQLIERANDFELTIVSPEEAEARGDLIAPQRVAIERDWRRYAWATATVAAATAAAYLVDRILPVESLSLIFLVAVVLTAARFGPWPSLYASVASFVAYNFLFTEPFHTLYVADPGDVLTLFLFFAVAVFTGNLAARLQRQARVQRAITRRTANLYEFSRKIAVAASLDDIVWAAVHHVASTLQCHALILMPDESGTLEIKGGIPPEDRLEMRDRGAAEWAWDHGEPAGWGSSTLPAAAWLFLPLKTGQGRLGLLGVSFEARGSRRLAPEERRLLDALVDQVAFAVERVELVADIEHSRVLSETERLRAALLSSVSHDLRTPLVSIIGCASSLRDTDMALSAADRAALTDAIAEEAARLNRFVQNLLDMTRLGHGALELNRDWVDLRELVGLARRQTASVLGDRAVEIEVAADMPLVHVDPVLMEQVMVNLLDNAAKHAPGATPVTVTAEWEGERVTIRVADRGAGIPAADRERVFDMFYRVRAGDSRQAGTGLGLAICRSIVEAHGGTIRALAGEGGVGTTMEIALPLAASGPPEACMEEASP